MRRDLAAILSLLACQAAPAPALAKPAAAVHIEADIKSAGAHLALSFAAPGRRVEVHLQGVDGLQLVRPTPSFFARDVQLGEQTKLTVGFAQAVPRGTLVVTVEGDFDGVAQRLVRSFRVGGPPSLQVRHHRLRPAPGGRPPLHLVPAVQHGDQ